MKISRNWTHIRRIGLRIKPFESQGCYQSNGNPPDPQNCHRKFKIWQKSNGPHRPHCPLNLAINRKTMLEKAIASHRVQHDTGCRSMLQTRPGMPLNSPCWETVTQWIGGACPPAWNGPGFPIGVSWVTKPGPRLSAWPSGVRRGLGCRN